MDEMVANLSWPAQIGLVLLVQIALFGVPLFRIFERAGLNRATIGFLVVPVFGPMILLGMLAFSDWPNEPEEYR